jgi:hypothetical protein
LSALQSRVDQTVDYGHTNEHPNRLTAGGQLFSRFERPGTRCGTTRYLLPRLRLADAARRFVGLHLSIRFSRLQLIERISSSRTSQSSICEASTACVEPREVNKWKRDFAARIFFNDFNRA